jgi:ATP-dependent Clp protease ATP-binding subunit ClpC
MYLAGCFATHRNSDFVEGHDVLFAMIRESVGIAGNVLRTFGVEPRAFGDKCQLPLEERQELSECSQGRLSVEVKRLLDFAIQECHWLNHHYVGTEHLLLGLCRTEGGTAAGVLEQLNVSLGELSKECMNVLGSGSEEWKRRHPEIDFTSGVQLYIFADRDKGANT